MDNLFEIIIPIIFAAIYFFGNMLSGKSEDGEAPPPAPRRGNEDPDAVERQRRIQEEIRRKIMERRQAGEGSQVGTPVPRRPQAEARPSNRSSEVKPALRPEPTSHMPLPTSRRPEPEAAFSWDQSDDVYANRMQERLRQIEATKRQAEKLQKQAAEAGVPASKRPQSSLSPRPTSRSPLARGSVRRTLRDPGAARAAFIYGEVLGPPVSMKKTPSVPGLAS